MSHAAKIIADSISPEGVRLTTFEITFPRIILAEFNTHRVFSRNSASSRAIPVEKMLKMVVETPYIPIHWGKNQKGMSADEEVGERIAILAEADWKTARDYAVHIATHMMELGIHKQITNRLLEPFLWHQVVVTATEWSNFFHLRDHKDAHPEIQKIARMMRDLYDAGKPQLLGYGGWHLPYIMAEDLAEVAYGSDKLPIEAVDLLKRVSVGRCAAVSYMRQNIHEMRKDAARCDIMLANGHMSPFEHVARPMAPEETGQWIGREEGNSPSVTFCGNFRGWVSFRKHIPNESDILNPQ